MKTRILLLFTLLCAAMTSLQGVHAVTITVMNTNDSGAGSLRAALISANDGDTIDFQAAVTGTVTLTTGQLVVDKSVVISGPGANNLTVDANHASRVFYVSPSKTVTISGLTITNGSFNGNGGGIYNDHATLTVTNSTLSGNSASVGGAIYNWSGSTLTITNTTFSGNFCSNPSWTHGGGIYNEGATLKIGNTIFKAGSSGENIYNVDGISGGVTSLGYNLSSDDGGGYLTATGDRINTDPKLGPLQNNGGPTFTHLPAADSPAINGSDPAVSMDQRGPGFVRVVNGRADIGAIEVQAAPSPTPTPTPTPRPHGRH